MARRIYVVIPSQRRYNTLEVKIVKKIQRPVNILLAADGLQFLLSLVELFKSFPKCGQ